MAVYRERLQRMGGEDVPVREVRMFSLFGWEWWRRVEVCMSPVWEARAKALEHYRIMLEHIEDAEAASKYCREIVNRVNTLGSPSDGVGPSYMRRGFALFVRSKRVAPNPGPPWDDLRKFLKKGGGKAPRATSTDYIPQESEQARRTWIAGGRKADGPSALIGFKDPLNSGGQHKGGQRGQGQQNQKGKGNQQQQQKNSPTDGLEGLSDIEKDLEHVYPGGVPDK